MRHNRKNQGRPRDPFEYYDRVYVFRPELPHIKYFISHSRKIIQINMDAYFDAWITVEQD